MKITDKNMKKWVDLLESDIQQEALDRPFLYDVEDEPPVVTVGQLKKILAQNFKDTDQLVLLDSDSSECSIKAIWNSEMENEITQYSDNDCEDNLCFIRIA